LRLQRASRAAASVLALTVAGLAVGGCSFSYQLGSLFGKDDEAAPKGASITGSTSTLTPPALKTSAVPNGSNAALGVADADIALATAAATKMFATGSKGASMPWENPATGARGTVTAVAEEYRQDGFICREFLASFVTTARDSWLQGEACRFPQGQWVVRSLKPWKSA
jgi:surface antigen